MADANDSQSKERSEPTRLLTAALKHASAHLGIHLVKTT